MYTVHGEGDGSAAISAATFKEAIVVGLMRPSGVCDLDALELFRRTPFFRRFGPRDLEDLARGAQRMSFRPGERLCLEGSPPLACYAIASGEVEVTVDGRRVAIVGARDVVGERGPIEGRTRSATVIARGPVTTWAVSRERLLSFARRSPMAASGMFDHLGRRYADFRGAARPRFPL